MVYSILHIILLSCKMLPFWPGSVVVNHAVEYGLIFHGTRTGKYYCKNMKYRINIFIPYCLSNSGGLSVIYPCFSADIALFSADIALF